MESKADLSNMYYLERVPCGFHSLALRFLSVGNLAVMPCRLCIACQNISLKCFHKWFTKLKTHKDLTLHICCAVGLALKLPSLRKSHSCMPSLFYGNVATEHETCDPIQHNWFAWGHVANIYVQGSSSNPVQLSSQVIQFGDPIHNPVQRLERTNLVVAFAFSYLVGQLINSYMHCGRVWYETVLHNHLINRRVNLPARWVLYVP